jgi:RNA recognition motif-containing protein
LAGKWVLKTPAAGAAEHEKGDRRPHADKEGTVRFIKQAERIEKVMNIYVGNLPYSIDRDQLREIFAAYGEVAAARIVNDRETGRSKGFGFVEMADNAQAQAAIEALNGSDIGGRKAVVNEARPREERPMRG